MDTTTAVSDPFAHRVVVLEQDEADRLTKWLNEAANLLGICGWEIRMSVHGADKGADATSWLGTEGDFCVVSVAATFRDEAPLRQRAILAHELMHCYTHRLVERITDVHNSILGAQAATVLSGEILLAEELMVDRIGRAVAKWLPPVPAGNTGGGGNGAPAQTPPPQAPDPAMRQQWEDLRDAQGYAYPQPAPPMHWAKGPGLTGQVRYVQGTWIRQRVDGGWEPVPPEGG